MDYFNLSILMQTKIYPIHFATPGWIDMTGLGFNFIKNKNLDGSLNKQMGWIQSINYFIHSVTLNTIRLDV